MQRVFSNLIFLAVLLAGVYYIVEEYILLCDIPVKYTIGKFDSRFNISREILIQTAKEAEEIWEDAAGRNLFDYTIDDGLAINMNFDERQEKTIAANRSERGIEATKSNYDVLFARYRLSKDSYDIDIQSYNISKISYSQQAENYNNKVAQINAAGGATQSQASELENEKNILQIEASRLERVRIDLNRRAIELNQLASQINEIARQLNINVELHNESFGQARAFDQADYTGEDINIYQFDAIADLRLVLAHEMGHALGIDHVENPYSIMYYLMDKQDLSNPRPSFEDMIALRKSCRI